MHEFNITIAMFEEHKHIQMLNVPCLSEQIISKCSNALQHAMICHHIKIHKNDWPSCFLSDLYTSRTNPSYGPRLEYENQVFKICSKTPSLNFHV
jgi:hypothetical protein